MKQKYLHVQGTIVSHHVTNVPMPENWDTMSEEARRSYITWTAPGYMHDDYFYDDDDDGMVYHRYEEAGAELFEEWHVWCNDDGRGDISLDEAAKRSVEWLEANDYAYDSFIARRRALVVRVDKDDTQ